jgi:putative isomerase
MMTESRFLTQLHNRIDLTQIPFTERGSRLMLFRQNNHLLIRLAERWFKLQDQVGDYRHREPILDNWQFTDSDGRPLDFTLTSFPHRLRFDTPAGPFEAAFMDQETLYFALPPGRSGITCRIWADKGRADRRGAEFVGPRRTALTTNALLLNSEITPDENGFLRLRLAFDAQPGASLLLNITPRLGFNRSIPPADEVFMAAERRWHEWFAAVPPVAERFYPQYLYAWWVMRAGLVSSRFYMTREGMTPSKIHYVGVWQWDAFFHAIAYRHVDTRLAEDQLRIVLDHQRDDGLIPDAVHDEGIVTHWNIPVDADVTKPPIITWSALKLYESSGHRDFLDEIYEPLTRWNRWWFEFNDPERDGIVQYYHPYSSGLDDSPLWDEGMPVESPDLNTYLVLQMQSLARIATILGLEDDANTWAKQADELTERMVEHFWDEQVGVFWATRNHQPIQVLTPFNLYPMWTGRLPTSIVQRLVGHLTNPAEFWTTWPIPTVARSDPKYDPQQMWRGPTWVNINYLFVEMLERNGYRDLARQLRDKTLDLIMQHDDIYEYYHPETGARPPKAATLFGWSSAVFIDLAIRASRGSDQ